MSTGTVKWFSERKGYGFIVPDESGEELFVHHSDIKMDGTPPLMMAKRSSMKLEKVKKAHVLPT